VEQAWANKVFRDSCCCGNGFRPVPALGTTPSFYSGASWKHFQRRGLRLRLSEVHSPAQISSASSAPGSGGRWRERADPVEEGGGGGWRRMVRELFRPNLAPHLETDALHVKLIALRPRHFCFSFCSRGRSLCVRRACPIQWIPQSACLAGIPCTERSSAYTLLALIGPSEDDCSEISLSAWRAPQPDAIRAAALHAFPAPAASIFMR